ncbi:MAG: hypothetical protein WC455_15110 [Dehalococcoidia bacterium]|jgi:hypothetical protein
MQTTDSYIQEIVNKAVKIATSAAMHGNPVRGVIWIPQVSPTHDIYGSFAAIPGGTPKATETPWWEE